MAAAVLTGIKNLMQKEIFDPNDEKLKSIISVTKSTGRSKKKSSYLSLSGELLGEWGVALVLPHVNSVDFGGDINRAQ